jgi:uncharacterized membrane protein YdfJ with MMPL/SSD domain
VFAAWGSWVARHRWPVLVIVLAAILGAGVWGVGVFGRLSEGGYTVPDSESSRAADVVQAALGAQGADIVIVYTPAAGSIDDAALGKRVRARLAALPRDAVTATDSYWSGGKPRYAEADKSRAVAVVTLAGQGDAGKLAAYKKVAGDFAVEGTTSQVAGAPVLADAAATVSTRDLGRAEAVSLPIVLILLLFIFGSLVAASLPVLVGASAVLGALGVLHAISLGHDVNSFAANVASLLGLGMAIDYGLFIVGRFREEQGFGRTTSEAVGRSIATAGRTVLFSATLLMIALAGLLLFPQGFLKSLAYGGLSAVALAALLSLTLLPAMLAILGPGIDKLPVRLPGRSSSSPAGSSWARLAGVVLRRPILFALPIVAGLLLLAAPIRGVSFGDNDERILPATEPARQAIETLKADFPALSSAGVQVVLHRNGAAAGSPSSTAFAADIKKVPGVAAVTQTGAGGDVVVLTATLQDHDPFGTPARTAVRDIRALTPPAGTEVLVGGATARNVDSLEATAHTLPLMVSMLVGATLILMFLAFGSILLPIKAVLVSALSLSATFGTLIWIFEDGHGAGLLNVTPAPPEVGIVVLMGAVVFGLSTDYEVFLLSRMVEARTRGATTAEAVTTGLARTGRVISAAAILLIVVTGAFALSSVTTMRFVGVGMIIALFLDATVVRLLLVPAILKLLGDAAWWAPGPLRSLQAKASLAEYAGEELFPTISVGRHAAPLASLADPGADSARTPVLSAAGQSRGTALRDALPSGWNAAHRPRELASGSPAFGTASGKVPQTLGDLPDTGVGRRVVLGPGERRALGPGSGPTPASGGQTGPGEWPALRGGIVRQSAGWLDPGDRPAARSVQGAGYPSSNERPWVPSADDDAPMAGRRPDFLGGHPRRTADGGNVPQPQLDIGENAAAGPAISGPAHPGPGPGIPAARETTHDAVATADLASHHVQLPRGDARGPETTAVLELPPGNDPREPR